MPLSFCEIVNVPKRLSWGENNKLTWEGGDGAHTERVQRVRFYVKSQEEMTDRSSCREQVRRSSAKPRVEIIVNLHLQCPKSSMFILQLVCVYVFIQYTHTPAIAHMWKSEKNLGQLVLFPHHICLGIKLKCSGLAISVFPC